MHTHTGTHTAGTNACACVCVCVCVHKFRSACGCVSACALCSCAWMVRILLCLFKAATIKLQTLELNHKHWEILLLTQCLTQDCPTPYATCSDLDRQHERYFQILRTFSSGNMQPLASISQTTEVPQKESFVFPKALKIGGAYLV